MKKFYVFIIFSLSLIFLVNSCKPEEYGTPNNTPEIGTISKQVKDYIFFQQGAWWVYQDSVTKQFDTIQVTKSSQGKDTVKNSKGQITGIYDWTTNTLTSSHDSYQYDIDLHSSWKDNLVFQYKYKSGNAPGKVVYYFTPFEIGKKKSTLCSDGETVAITNVIDSYSLNFKNYTECVEFSISKSCLENDKPVKHILSKNIGLVEKRIGANEANWQLIDFNIVQ